MNKTTTTTTTKKKGNNEHNANAKRNNNKKDSEIENSPIGIIFYEDRRDVLIFIRLFFFFFFFVFLCLFVVSVPRLFFPQANRNRPTLPLAYRIISSRRWLHLSFCRGFGFSSEHEQNRREVGGECPPPLTLHLLHRDP